MQVLARRETRQPLSFLQASGNPSWEKAKIKNNLYSGRLGKGGHSVGSRKRKVKTSCKRNKHAKQTDNTNLRNGKGSASEAVLSKVYYKTLLHFFPFF